MKINVWIRYILLLVIVLGLVSIAGFCLFYRSLDYMDKSITSECYTQLDIYRVETDSRLREIEVVLDQIIYSTEIRTLSALDSPVEAPQNEERFRLANEMVQTYTQRNEFIEHILIHFPANDVVLSANQSYLRLDDCYGNDYSWAGSDREEWLKELYRQPGRLAVSPRRQVVIHGEAASRITFVQTIPSASGSQPAGAVVITVNERSFLQTMPELIGDYQGQGFLMWNDKIIAATNPGEIAGPDEECEVHLQMELGSDIPGWGYHFILSISALQGNIRKYRNTGLTMMWTAISLSAVIFILFLASRLNAINRILATFRYQKGNIASNELEFINNSVNDLFAINSTLQERVESFHPIIVNEFWGNLLRGQITTLNDAQYYLMQMDPLDFETPHLAVVFRIDGIGELGLDLVNELNMMKVSLDGMLKQTFEQYVYGCNIGPPIWVMVCRATPDEKAFHEAVQTIAGDFQATYGYQLLYAIGDRAPGIMDIFLSFSSAIIKVCKEFFHKMPSRFNALSYPLTIMHNANLVRMLKCGEDEAVSQYLASLFDKHYLEGDMPQWMRPQYTHALLTAFLLAYNDLRHNLPSFPHEAFAEKIERAYRCTDVEAQLDQAKEIQHLFSKAVQQSRAKMGSPHMEKILPFIHEHLYEYGLSLEMVADHFQMGKTYLSSHFKEHSGETFSAYVEKLRIEASCELMRSGKHKVGEIAKEIGYSCSQVYRRAFKRVMGVSPTKYISMLRCEGGEE